MVATEPTQAAGLASGEISERIFAAVRGAFEEHDPFRVERLKP